MEEKLRQWFRMQRFFQNKRLKSLIETTLERWGEKR